MGGDDGVEGVRFNVRVRVVVVCVVVCVWGLVCAVVCVCVGGASPFHSVVFVFHSRKCRHLLLVAPIRPPQFINHLLCVCMDVQVCETVNV